MKDVIYSMIITILVLITAYCFTMAQSWKHEVENTRDYYKGQYEDLKDKEDYIVELQDKNSDLNERLNNWKVKAMQLEKKEKKKYLLHQKTGKYLIVVGRLKEFQNDYYWAKNTNKEIVVDEPYFLSKQKLPLSIDDAISRKIGDNRVRMLIEIDQYSEEAFKLMEYQIVKQ